jgi:hypothetical protein
MRARVQAAIRRPVFCLLTFLLLAPPASAELIKEDWQCGQRIEVTAALLAHFTSSYAVSGDADMPSFVAGTLKSDEGETLSVLFVHGATGWAGYAVQHQGGFASVTTVAASKQAVLFSMIDVEGPGKDYTVISTDDAFKHIACGILPAPAISLGTLDYMSITSLELDSGGQGLLHGRVDFSQGRPPACFVSETKDGGKSWSVPRQTQPCASSNDPESDPRSSVQ